MSLTRVGIVGATGYVGGELLRLLIKHPSIEVTYVTSRRRIGEYVYRVHPNLRGHTNLKFMEFNVSRIGDECDIVFSCLPHGAGINSTKELIEVGFKVIDLSADYRLKNPLDYEKYYGFKHPYPDLLEKSVYGLPEIHRDEIKNASLIACPGCIATSAILALTPMAREKLLSEPIVIDAMIGSSAAGSKPSIYTHHPERSNVIRPYKPVGHRHTAEIEQELSLQSKKQVKVSLSTFAVDVVRGILSATHLFTNGLEERDVWRIYRKHYSKEPFIKFLKDQRSILKLPDPKIAVGTNNCYLAFELDDRNSRVVILSAIDNLVKGAAGNAVQSLNIIMGVDEATGLDLIPPHPA